MTHDLHPWGPNKGDNLTDYSRYRNPAKLLEELVECARSRAFLLPGLQSKPGEFYALLPKEYKDVLKNLKSEDLQVSWRQWIECDYEPLWGRRRITVESELKRIAEEKSRKKGK